MTVPAMQPALGPKARDAGYRLAAFETIGSTNTEAMARGRSGDPGRLWLVADEQTAGRGRRGRPWSAERGNLAASLLTVTAAPIGTAATLGFVAGVALQRALSAVLPAEAAARVALKWPNDVVADGAKLAGILLEAESIVPGRLAVVIGIGVNIRSVPAGLPYRATSIADLGSAAASADLFRDLAEAWVDAVAAWNEGRGLDAIRTAWLERAFGLGRPVSVEVGTRRLSGVFETLDGDGRLVMRQADGRREAIAAGDVHFGDAASVPVDPGASTL
jgi:BirA family biotin operon repressor/biotin-[acetyl-CoA-carboxylase] ligase